MMYRVRLYDWLDKGMIGDAYDTNVLPAAKMLISYNGDVWEVLTVRHVVAQPGSAIALKGAPEWIEAKVALRKELS